MLFEARHLMLEPLEAPCCPFGKAASSSSELVALDAPTYRWRSVRWHDSRSRRTRLWRVRLGRVARSSSWFFSRMPGLFWVVN